MKILSWVEVALATPMVLAFSSMGGAQTVAAASILLGIVMSVLKWGKSILRKKNTPEIAAVKAKAAN